MPFVVLHHRVEDYGRWRSVFDQHAEARAAAGLANERVYRGVEDGNDLVLIGDVVDEARLQAFMKSEEVWAKLREAGVLEPVTFHILPSESAGH